MSNTPLSDPLMRQPGLPRRRRSARIKVLGLVLSSCLVAIVLEAALRLMGVGFPNFYAPDFHCGSRLRSNTSGVWTREGHGDIRINSLGFRSPEFAAKKPEGVFRICVLGDSFVESLQVDEADTFCMQLQKLANELRDMKVPPRNVEVINCGVSGYGTAQQLLLLQNYVLPLQPDAILLAIYPENDVRNNSRALEGDDTRPYFNLSETGELIQDVSFRTSHRWLVADSDYERVKASIVNRSRTLQLLQELRRQRSGTSGQKTDSESQLRQSVQESRYVYHPPESETSPESTAWRVTERLVEEIGAQCNKHRVMLFAFTVPSPVQVWPDDEMRDRLASEYGIEDWFYAENRLQTKFRQLGIPFYPLASGLKQAAVQERKFLTGFTNTAEGVGHWNELGQEIAAKHIFEWLNFSAWPPSF